MRSVPTPREHGDYNMLNAVTVHQLTLNDNVQMSLYSAMSGRVEIEGKILARLNSDGVPASANAATHHANIYRHLPDNVKAIYPDDWTAYNYLMIKANDSAILYVGEAWIIESALYVNTVSKATITLTDFRDPDTTAIRALLLSNGYKIDKIEVSE
jgi:hypothetical protein